MANVVDLAERLRRVSDWGGNLHGLWNEAADMIERQHAALTEANESLLAGNDIHAHQVIWDALQQSEGDKT